MQLNSQKEYLVGNTVWSLLATQSYQQNRKTSEKSRKCLLPACQGHRNQWLLIVKQQEHPFKEENLKSPWTPFLFTLPQYAVEHTLRVYHIHTHSEVCADKQTKKDQCWYTTCFLYTRSLRFVHWRRTERKRTQEKGNASSSLCLKKTSCTKLDCFSLFHFSFD